MKKVIFICFILFITPMFVHGAITINEVAWMGNGVSANDEWIELYNTGNQSVNVDGWIVSDGVNLNIELTGSIAAGQYAVLERTDDASAPGTAFLIYTGALSNSGATLSLYRADGALEDRVVGGDDWENIGGDNITKETAQYTSAGWVTSIATPGMPNTSGALVAQDTDNTQSTTDEDTNNIVNAGTANTSSDSSNTATLYTTPRDLLISLEVPNRVYVNQEVPMRIVSSGLAKGILQSVQYQWNLGDLSVAAGQDIVTRYTYPGEYVITVTGGYKQYQASARAIITVLPVAFSMTLSPKGEVQVHNNARYEVDISQYRLVSDSVLVFPKGTMLLPNATITIPKEKLKYRAQVVLLDEVGTEVSRLTSESSVVKNIDTQRTPQTTSQIHTDVISKAVSVHPESDTPFTFIEQETSNDVSTISQFPSSTLASQEITKATVTTIGKATASDMYQNSIEDPKLPYILLLGVIAIGIFGVFIGRAR